MPNIDLDQFHGEDCPDLSVVLRDMFVSLAQKTNTKICTEAQNIIKIVDDRATAVDGRFDAVEDALQNITNVENFTELVNRFNELVEAIDLDKDGSVANDLLNLKNQLEAVLVALESVRELASTANFTANTALEAATALQTAFADFQKSLSDKYDGLAARVSTVEGDIAEIKEAIANIDVDAESARDIYCSISTKLNNVAASIMDAVEVEFKECELRPTDSTTAETAPAAEAEPATAPVEEAPTEEPNFDAGF